MLARFVSARLTAATCLIWWASSSDEAVGHERRNKSKLEKAADFLLEEHSLRKVEQMWGVLKSILFDAARRRKDAPKPDLKTYLTDAEEAQLVHFLINCANFGYPRSRKQDKNTA